MAELNQNLLSALPVQNVKYYKTHFSIDSGYQWGRGMPIEDTARFFHEITTLFEKAGWTVETSKTHSGCPTVHKEGNALYCHPMELSGPCQREFYPEVIQLLSQAQSCRYRAVFTYDQIYDITDREYEQALDQARDDIELDLMEAFSTHRKDIYHTGYYSNLERVAEHYRIPTLDRYIGICSDDIHMKYITAAFQNMVGEGRILRREHPDRGTTYRSATGSELMELIRRKADSLDTKIKSAEEKAGSAPTQSTSKTVTKDCPSYF